MEKRTLEMAYLLDFYGELLTEKQREHLDLYYNEDFSLAEIARLGGITPQGVRDSIRRGEAVLFETEAKTGLLARFKQVSNTAESIRRRVSEIETQVGEEALAPLFQEIHQALDSLEA